MNQAELMKLHEKNVQVIHETLSTLKALFCEHVRMTLVVRVPGHENAEFIVSEDDLLGVRGTVERVLLRNTH